CCAQSVPVIPLLSPGGPPIEARPRANTPNAKVEPRGQKVPFSERSLAQLSSPDPGGPVVAIAPPVAPTPAPSPVPAPAPERPTGTDKEDVDWMWPVKGKFLSPFTEAAKGVDIGGRKGAPVLARASGRVLHAGRGRRRVGQLAL